MTNKNKNESRKIFILIFLILFAKQNKKYLKYAKVFSEQKFNRKEACPMGFKDVVMLHMFQLMNTLGAAGDKTANYVKQIIGGITNVIMIGGGAWLVAMGVKDLVKAMSGENKDVKNACIAIGVIVLGGLLGVIGVVKLTSIAHTMGQDFNVTP